MKRLLLSIAAVCLGLFAMAQQAVSPNGKITITPKDSGLIVNYQGRQLLEISTLGFENASTPSALSRMPQHPVYCLSVERSKKTIPC